jgi:hypothetical protein
VEAVLVPVTRWPRQVGVAFRIIDPSPELRRVAERGGVGVSDRNARAAAASPVGDRFAGGGVIELALLGQPGRARSTSVDQVMWVSVGARMARVARRSTMNTVPIAAAARTRAMFKVATVTST